MWSLDGTLRYIPLAALHDGQRYLIERYALALYTAAARENLSNTPTSDWQVAGLGTSEARLDFPALPAVPNELEGIVRRDDQDTTGVVPGVVYLNDAFTVKTLKTTLRQRYPVLHVASHFRLEPGNNTMSYLLLGDGDTLTLDQLNTGHSYKFRGVDLLTLSACNTAMGNNAQGQEVEGFAALAQKRGANGVLATLWPVADESTGLFMQHLYRLRSEDTALTKAEALRRTQVQFIRGDTAEAADAEATDDVDPRRGQKIRFSGGGAKDALPPFATDPDAPYAHPYYWAPFILMGNWL
jgi:CHAT domain-containing protein